MMMLSRIWPEASALAATGTGGEGLESGCDELIVPVILFSASSAMFTCSQITTRCVNHQHIYIHTLIHYCCITGIKQWINLKFKHWYYVLQKDIVEYVMAPADSC